MSQRLIRVTDEDFDYKGFSKLYAADLNAHVATHYIAPANSIDAAKDLQSTTSPAKMLNPSELTPEQRKEGSRLWNPFWASFSMIGLAAPLHKAVLKNEARNFIHPLLRAAAKPVALTVVAASALNAYSLTKSAHFDDRTAHYQAMANATWQLVNNYILPATIINYGSRFALKVMKNPTQMHRVSATYGSALVAISVAAAFAPPIKRIVEGYYMRSRFNRKDYGSHGQSPETNDMVDSPLQTFIQSFNDQGDEYIMDPRNEHAYAQIFPYFSLAEALPTHEVPINAHTYQHHCALPYQGALLQGTLDLTVEQGQVPIPSPNTFLRSNDQYGEWSLATPYQQAADRQLLGHVAGRKALAYLLKMAVDRV